MNVRSVDAGKGWQWIVDGFHLFKKSPLLWVALTIVLALLWILSFAIPVLGPLLFNLLSPVLFAGLMIGCRAVDSGEELELGHLFAGFRQHASALVTVGGVYLVGTIVVLGIVFVVAGGSMLPAVLSKSTADLETLAAAIRSMALAIAVGAAVYVPLMMLIWFAPLLVVFEGLAPVEAMKLSFAACWTNVVPFLVYGLVILVLWFVASIPLLLGLLVLLPVLFCSVYASYRDIFAAAPGPAAPGAGNPLVR
jgi:uncharacterized membrane protein